MKNFITFLFGLALMFGFTVANAAIDVSAATTSITTDGTAAISAVGAALIGLAGVAVVYKWVKGAIFG